MTTLKKLWVDDCRPPPSPEWDTAYSFHEAIYKLEHNLYDECSLDHDIDSFYGYKEMTGNDIVNWLERHKNDKGGYIPPIINVHSANPIGAAKMIQGIRKLQSS